MPGPVSDGAPASWRPLDGGDGLDRETITHLIKVAASNAVHACLYEDHGSQRGVAESMVHTNTIPLPNQLQAKARHAPDPNLGSHHTEEELVFGLSSQGNICTSNASQIRGTGWSYGCTINAGGSQPQNPCGEPPQP